MAVKSPRLTADPSVGVGDLVMVLQEYMDEKADTNLFKLVQAPNDSWKAAPPVPWLASLAPLFQRYAKVAPNSVILSSKHKVAIKRLVETKKINHTRKTNEDFADLIDNTIRMGLNHFRNMKQSSVVKERAYRRADKTQQDALDSVLGLLVVCKAEVDTQKDPVHDPTTTSLVPYERKDAFVLEDKETTPSPKHKAMKSSPSKVDISPNKVFDKVLASPKKDNVEQCKVDNCTLTIFNNVAQKDKPPKEDEESPLRGPWVLATSADDDDLVSGASSTKPLAEDGKSQQQRLNALKPKKKSKGNSKGKTTQDKKKGKGKGCKDDGTTKGAGESKKKGKGCKEDETTKDAGESGQASKKGQVKGTMKRPSASTSCLETVYDEGKFVIGKDIPGPDDDCDLSRTKIRHRFTSKAYHDTRNAMYKNYRTTETEAKDYGAAAARKAGQLFDAGWPKGIEHKKDEEGHGDVVPTASTKPMKAMKVKKKEKTSKEHKIHKETKVMKKVMKEAMKKGGKAKKMKVNYEEENENPEAEEGSWDEATGSYAVN